MAAPCGIRLLRETCGSRVPCCLIGPGWSFGSRAVGRPYPIPLDRGGFCPHHTPGASTLPAVLPSCCPPVLCRPPGRLPPPSAARRLASPVPCLLAFALLPPCSVAVVALPRCLRCSVCFRLLCLLSVLFAFGRAVGAPSPALCRRLGSWVLLVPGFPAPRVCAAFLGFLFPCGAGLIQLLAGGG